MRGVAALEDINDRAAEHDAWRRAQAGQALRPGDGDAAERAVDEADGGKEDGTVAALGDPVGLVDQLLCRLATVEVRLLLIAVASLVHVADGKHVGQWGDLATVSFYPAHHITMGEGGCVLTNAPKMKTILESFRDWGRDCW